MFQIALSLKRKSLAFSRYPLLLHLNQSCDLELAENRDYNGATEGDNDFSRPLLLEGLPAASTPSLIDDDTSVFYYPLFSVTSRGSCSSTKKSARRKTTIASSVSAVHHRRVENRGKMATDYCIPSTS